MNNIATRLFWWWGWSPSNMERMLENMASNGWYLWMKHYEGERPEIFTDTQSLIERNNRLIKLLLPIYVLLLVIFAILLAVNNDALKPLIYIYVALISL